MEQPSQTPKIIGAVAITAIMLIGIYVLILHNRTVPTTPVSTMTTTTSQPAASNTSNATPAGTSSSSDTATTSSFKDGTYTATADYSVPHDINTIKVTLTVQNGAIASVDTKHSYGDRESVRYINSFVSGISGAVVGKKLDAAQVGRLNGASDTAQGFNDALTTIISQAKN
jgi:uncharacterized protein with FMN-binding domain